MLKNILNRFGTTLYVQIWENRIKVTNLATRNVFDEKPLVAIETTDGGKQVIVAEPVNQIV